jgi:hypothetical protein
MQILHKHYLVHLTAKSISRCLKRVLLFLNIIHWLEVCNHNSSRIFQELSDHIFPTRNTLEQYEISCKQRKLEINKLNRQYTVSEELVNHFQENNEEYIKITQTVEDQVV